MADTILRTIPYPQPRPCWRQYQPGGWETGLLHGWRLHAQHGWEGDCELRHSQAAGSTRREWIRAADLRERDPADGRGTVWGEDLDGG